MICFKYDVQALTSCFIEVNLQLIQSALIVYFYLSSPKALHF